MDNFNDFHTVKDLKFDISKLQEGLKKILKINLKFGFKCH